MKKTILLFAAVVLVKLSVAQWSTSGTSVYTTNNSARVGIGTGSTLNAELEVKRDQASATMTRVRNLSSSAGAIARFQLDSYTTNSSQYSDLVQNSGSPYYRFWVGSAVTNVYFDGPKFAWRNAAGTTTWVTLTNTGSMGIGTATTGSFKLAVEGTIGTREIKVTSTTPWPDYVFKPGYRLPKLSDLENYILTHRHLPGIPSAEEVEQSGGVALGEMNRKLLEKVEELTLHIIELNKRIDQLERQPRPATEE